MKTAALVRVARRAWRARPPRVLAATAICLLTFGGVVLGRAATSRPDVAPTRSGREADAVPAPELASPVIAAPITRGPLVLSVDADGEARAPVVVLRAAVGGLVREVPVALGSSVRATAPVMMLDTSDLAHAAAVAGAQRAEAELRFRELSILAEHQPDGERRREHLRALRLRSGMEVAELAVAKAATDLARATVRAPRDGRIAGLLVQPGDRVQPGQEVARLVATGEVTIAVPLLEVDAPHVHPGARASVRFAALPGETFPARVVRIAPNVDPATRAVLAELRLDRATDRILPGMLAMASIEVGRRDSRLLVPRAALVTRDDRTVLFVVGDDRGLEHRAEQPPVRGRALWRYVRAGAGNRTHVDVEADDGELSLDGARWVLVEGHVHLAHLAPVRVSRRP